MEKTIAKQIGRQRRHNRIRAKVMGTATRPRLAVYKSNRYLHAQVIDDEAGKTLVSGSTKDVAAKAKKTDAAKMLGVELAKRAKAAGITEVVFDRGGFRYTGRVATLADAAREGGLKF
ncbi:MAG: 50S ribosomal protein L18 [Candidatus Pacebacteria bacterium]|nr:50S ribosomal protein L18 [Candidatus Paceibacterota bacterium]